MMKRFRNEEGQTLVLTALLGCILMGFMALAIDMGVSFRTQRRTQTQADAAAIAAALCGSYGGEFCKRFGGTDVGSVASGAATANGMPAGANFTVKQSPNYGQHSNSGYYEVIIKQPSAASFLGTFAGLFAGGGNANYNPLTVGARAVAGRVPGQTCLYVLNPTDKAALAVKGGGGGSKAPATLYAPGCTIQVNSSDPAALCTTGSSATIVTDSILVVGAQDKAGKCNQPQSNVQTGATGVTDPFGGMTYPSKGCDPAKNTFGLATKFPTAKKITGPTGKNGPELTYDSSTGVMTITGQVDGVAQSISNITESSWSPTGSAPNTNMVCFSDNNLTLTSPTLGGINGNNEVFVFQNGFTVGGTSTTVTINGTIDLAGGAFTETNNNLLIVGPTGEASDQPYTAFAFIATSPINGCSSSVNSMGTVPTGDGCLQLQFGSGTSTTAPTNTCSPTLKVPGIVGMVYAPKDVVYMQDSGGCLSATNIISDEFWDNGAVNIYNYNLAYTTSPLDVVRLVE